MEHYKIFLLCIIALLLPFFDNSQAKEDLIRIPVSISPLVQLPFIELSRSPRFFYSMNKDFYSKVTAIDVARNEDNDISETIQKSIGVVFLIAASSHISGTLTTKKLRYPKRCSKWTYMIPVKELLSESNKSLDKLTDKIKIYKIQQLAMKVLARKYGFSVETIIQKHRMNPMRFYAADEEQWIKIVGTITETVIQNRCTQLNLAPCYLAELINKTQKEMGGFTLKEVDIYLTNMTLLSEKLPAYQNETLRRFHKVFTITPTQLAKMSNINISAIKTMGIKDIIQQGTKSILEKLQINETAFTASANETICRSEWNPFRQDVVSIAFEKQAEEMSITPTTLGNLIGVFYKDITRLPLMKIIRLLEGPINHVKAGKRKIEKFTLSMLVHIHTAKRLNTKRYNAISFIRRVTKLRKRHLKMMYGWKSHDFHFARRFTVKDLGDECSFDVNTKTLISLAKINIGHSDINCTAFYALRLVWGQASLSDLKKLYHPNTEIAMDESIAATVSKLTNSSVRMSCRVLSKTPIIQWLLQKISLNNISKMTNHSATYLHEIPIQRIMLMIHELFNAGSFDSVIRVFKTINYSTRVSAENFTQEIFADDKSNGNGKPTAYQRSLSKLHLPDNALFMSILLIATLLIL